MRIVNGLLFAAPPIDLDIVMSIGMGMVAARVLQDDEGQVGRGLIDKWGWE